MIPYIIGQMKKGFPSNIEKYGFKSFQVHAVKNIIWFIIQPF